ncbi:MAG: alpha/beta fold hydrolase [Opitutaceae bacterium]|jgi:pimeloyl-ACP methyl ester carboxylesterase/membrane protein DedA with SNARE-associated domain
MKSRRFWAIYGLVLLASTLVRHQLAGTAHPGPGQQVATLAAIGGTAGDHVEMVYRDLRPPGKPDAPVLVLVHGSPVASVALDRLMHALAADFRLIVPDLPGMGRSEWRVPDYSVAAHARYVEELLEQLRVPKAQVVGYSMGGGVVIEMAGRTPELVASLTLISGLGVQERELFGDYTLNHAIHGAQLAGLWALDNLTPHFGLLDWFPLNVSFARNFYDTDQRPLRGLLAGWNGPTLIVHGLEDGLVPLSAAREHARLVPQSELLLMPGGGHGMIFGAEVNAIAARLGEFVREVESGRAATRATAPADRITASLPVADPQANAPWTGERRVVMLVLLVVATLVSEDLTCIAAGLLVATGKLTFGPAAVACFTGIFVGDLLLVLAGRWLGHGVLKRWPLRGRVSPEAVARAEQWFSQRGAWVILASRFMPGTRLPTYVAAGILRMPWTKFTLWFALACALWTPLLVGVAAVVGDVALGWLQAWAHISVWLVVIGLVVWMGAKIGVQAATWRGRRLLLGRWRRLTRWEFWPRWAVYPPVVVYCVWLALRHRGATLFTAVNPGIGAGGGLVGESKSEILRSLAGAGEAIAEWTLVPGGEVEVRWAQVRTFVETHGWPVVLKPDVGERGSGVVIARDESAARAALVGEPGGLIAQRYVPGVEYGIFYVRMPGTEHGEIFAVTDKRMVALTGDGRSSVETLILADDRAVCMGRFFLEQFSARLDEVPAAGARVTLTELGTHCRGAVFLDGGALITPALFKEVERVSRAFDGFYFGRYDVRTESAEALQRGEFNVIELNGLTSEATSIYDPKHSVWYGWRVLCRQWRLAFEIGAANRARGARVWTTAEVLALLKNPTS